MATLGAGLGKIAATWMGKSAFFQAYSNHSAFPKTLEQTSFEKDRDKAGEPSEDSWMYYNAVRMQG